MFILVKDKFNLEELGDSFLVLRLNDDGKTFSIIKDKAGWQSPKSEKIHNSTLAHFILSAYLFKLFKRDVKDEETN